jgi:cation:H+ antiporter
VHRAPMALMNMVSSNINQWTLLVAMLPVVYSMSAGTPSAIRLDDQQKLEVLMTLGQQLVGALFLANMELAWWEAAALFVLWLLQFVFSAFGGATPLGQFGEHVRWGVTGVYFAWAAVDIVRLLAKKQKPPSFTEFVKMWRTHVRAGASRHVRQ